LAGRPHEDPGFPEFVKPDRDGALGDVGELHPMQRLAVFHQGSIDLLVPVRPHVQPSVHEVGRGYGLERPRRLLPALRLLARRCFLPSAYWNSQFREPLRAAESRSRAGHQWSVFAAGN
jgi:hypothetical protein